MVDIPASFKTLTSAIRRAEEADRSNDRDAAILAYACRMSAVSKATKLTTNAKEETAFIISQLDLLETAKKTHTIAESDCVSAVRRTAATVFDKADEIDRQGLADKATAKLFYAAVTYYDVLEFYGPLDNETSEKRKYSKWKAAEILNACNSGVRPTPGGYGEMADFSASASSSASAPPVTPSLSAPPALPLTQPFTQPFSQPTLTPTPAAYAPPAPTAPQNFFPAPTPSPAHTPHSAYTHPPAVGFGPSPGASRAPPLNNADPRVKDAMEICQFAISALKHNELQLARERLQEALRRLG